VEEDESEAEAETDESVPAGYQLSVQLEKDLTVDGVEELLSELTLVRRLAEDDTHAVDMRRDLCPDTNLTYLDKVATFYVLHRVFLIIREIQIPIHINVE
jgi:hypothetical protein